jgi:hypothetical protein
MSIFQRLFAWVFCAALLAASPAAAFPPSATAPAGAPLDANGQVSSAANAIALGGLPPKASSYTGVVATGAVIPNTISGSNLQIMCRAPMIMRGNVTSGKLAFDILGFYVPGAAAESAPAANFNCTGALEYPVGVEQQMTSGGGASTSISVPAGSHAVSDNFANPPPPGAMFWTRLYCTTTGAGRVVYRTIGENNGAACTVGASGVADQTMGGTVANNLNTQSPASNAGGTLTPIVIGQTNSRSECLTGDSRTAATGDTFDGGNNVDVGMLARSIGPFAAYINLGVGSDQAAQYIASHANRLALSAYCSDQIWAYPYNDFYTGGVSAATAEGYATTFKSYFPAGTNVSLVTIMPSTTAASVPITTLVANGPQMTATVASTALNFVGETITIAGATPSTDNGACTINAITSGTVFTCVNPLGTGTATATGTVTYTAPWLDPINQTITSPGVHNPDRIAYNQWCRTTAVSLGFKACLDIANVVEAGQDSGTWSAFDAAGRQTALTGDGIHLLIAGYLKIKASGVISPKTLY